MDGFVKVDRNRMLIRNYSGRSMLRVAGVNGSSRTPERFVEERLTETSQDFAFLSGGKLIEEGARRNIGDLFI